MEQNGMFENSEEILSGGEKAQDLSAMEEFTAPPKKKVSVINIITIQAIICTIVMIGAVVAGTFAPSTFEYCRRNYQTLVSADTQTFLTAVQKKLSAEMIKLNKSPKSDKSTSSNRNISSNRGESSSAQSSQAESENSSSNAEPAADSPSSGSTKPRVNTAKTAGKVSGSGGSPQAVQKLGDIPSGATVLPVAITIDFSRPTKTGRISSYFGQRIHPITGVYEFHTALDIAAAKNTPVYAVADGKVIASGKDKFLGKYVYIKHANGFYSKYGHLNKRCVKKGKTVKSGELIGKVGTTGYSTGYHLHLQLQKNKVAFNPLFVFKYA